MIMECFIQADIHVHQQQERGGGRGRGRRAERERGEGRDTNVTDQRNGSDPKRKRRKLFASTGPANEEEGEW